MNKPKIENASPAKSAIEELDYLRTLFREVVTQYSASIESDMLAVRTAISELQAAKRLPTEKAHDLREMLGLLRRLDLKPQKGRRRDLKKIETVIDDLRDLTENW